MPMRPSPLLWLPLLAACSTDAGSATSGDEPLSACACIPDDEQANPNRPQDPSAPTCGESPCPLVEGACEACAESPPLGLTVDDAALECALVALRDRTPGVLSWRWDEDGGWGVYEGYVLVNDDGSAVRREWSQVDLGFEASDAALGELPPPERFAACLTDPDPGARFDCLRAELDTPLEVCDAGWSCTDCW